MVFGTNYNLSAFETAINDNSKKSSIIYSISNISQDKRDVSIRMEKSAYLDTQKQGKKPCWRSDNLQRWLRITAIIFLLLTLIAALVYLANEEHKIKCEIARLRGELQKFVGSKPEPATGGSLFTVPQQYWRRDVDSNFFWLFLEHVISSRILTLPPFFKFYFVPYYSAYQPVGLLLQWPHPLELILSAARHWVICGRFKFKLYNGWNHSFMSWLIIKSKQTSCVIWFQSKNVTVSRDMGWG